MREEGMRQGEGGEVGERDRGNGKGENKRRYQEICLERGEEGGWRDDIWRGEGAIG